jgi:hypothetical protein
MSICVCCHFVSAFSGKSERTPIEHDLSIVHNEARKFNAFHRKENYVRPNRSKHIVPYRFRCVKHFFKKRENRYLVRFSPGHFPDISRTFPGHFIPVQAVFGCICAVFSLLRTIFAMCP